MRGGSPLRAAVLWLLFAPFLALALLPPGVMPARAGDGAARLVLCTGDGPVAMAVDPATGAAVPVLPAEGSADRADGRGCDWFFALSTLAPAAPPMALVPAPRGRARRLLPAPVAQPGEVRRNGLPPATGPPSAA